MQLAGLQSDVIKTVQIALNARGYGPLVVDGIQGPKTTAAIKEFQAKAGLAVDGIVGPKTAAALAAPIKTDNTPLPATLPPMGSGVDYGSAGSPVMNTGSPSSSMPTNSTIFSPPPQVVEIAAQAPSPQGAANNMLPLLIGAAAVLAIMTLG